ncbi:MAG: hypothetical protein J6C13_03280 [Clostridia bacterium]|nr:hypothetical protein [Clostridia bacterium]
MTFKSSLGKLSDEVLKEIKQGIEKVKTLQKDIKELKNPQITLDVKEVLTNLSKEVEFFKPKLVDKIKRNQTISKVTGHKFYLDRDDFLVVHKFGENNPPTYVYRIVAVRDFETLDGVVKRGDRGGYVEKLQNIAHDDGSWAFDNSIIAGEFTQMRGNSIARDGVVCLHDWATIINCDFDGKINISGVENTLIQDSEFTGNISISGECNICDARVVGQDIVLQSVQLNKNKINIDLLDEVQRRLESSKLSNLVTDNAKLYNVSGYNIEVTENAIVSSVKGNNFEVRGNAKIEHSTLKESVIDGSAVINSSYVISSKIKEHPVISGGVIDRSKISGNVKIENSSIQQDSEISGKATVRYAEINSSIIDNNAIIEGSENKQVLIEKCKIADEVEIYNSIVENAILNESCCIKDSKLSGVGTHIISNNAKIEESTLISDRVILIDKKALITNSYVTGDLVVSDHASIENSTLMGSKLKLERTDSMVDKYLISDKDIFQWQQELSEQLGQERLEQQQNALEQPMQEYMENNPQYSQYQEMYVQQEQMPNENYYPQNPTERIFNESDALADDYDISKIY